MVRYAADRGLGYIERPAIHLRGAEVVVDRSVQIDLAPLDDGYTRCGITLDPGNHDIVLEVRDPTDASGSDGIADLLLKQFEGTL